MQTTLQTVLVALVVIEAFISTVVVLAILRYALVNKRLPMVASLFRALSGPFEALGMDALIVAGLIFVSISAFKFLAAWWLWNGQLDGAVLQLVLLGVSAIFWYGFAVPYGPVLGIPQVVLIVLLWPDFH